MKNLVTPGLSGERAVGSGEDSGFGSKISESLANAVTTFKDIPVLTIISVTAAHLCNGIHFFQAKDYSNPPKKNFILLPRIFFLNAIQVVQNKLISCYNNKILRFHRTKNISYIAPVRAKTTGALKSVLYQVESEQYLRLWLRPQPLQYIFIHSN